MNTAWLYCRISKEDREGRRRKAVKAKNIANPIQAARLEAYCDYRFVGEDVRWGSDTVVMDRCSAKVPFFARTGGSSIEQRMTAGDHIVVMKLDRAFRSVVDAIVTHDQAIERGIVWHFLDIGVDTSQPIGRLIMTVVASFAELERARIKERTKEGLDWRRKKGFAMGGPDKVGWRKEDAVVDGKKVKLMLPFEEERDQMRLIARLHDKEKMTFQAIVDKFKEEGILNLTNGQNWSYWRVNKAYKVHKSKYRRE